MTGKSRLFRLASDRSGSAIIEFAVLAPLLLALMIGVLQFGIAMRDYNSLRTVAASTARYAAVNYQASNPLLDTQIAAYAQSLATNSPYKLHSSRLVATVTTPTSQPVSGAIEKTITLTYTEKSLLKFKKVGKLGSITIHFTRPFFVLSS